MFLEQFFHFSAAYWALWVIGAEILQLSQGYLTHMPH